MNIPGYSNYQVSVEGIVTRLSGRYRNQTPIVSQTPSSNGYFGVKLKNDEGKWKRVYVHTLVMLAYVGPRPDGLVINHKDGNKANNSVSNLEYCTQKENERHSLKVLGKKHYHDHNGRFISHITKRKRLV